MGTLCMCDTADSDINILPIDMLPIEFLCVFSSFDVSNHVIYIRFWRMYVTVYNKGYKNLTFSLWVIGLGLGFITILTWFPLIGPNKACVAFKQDHGKLCLSRFKHGAYALMLSYHVG